MEWPGVLQKKLREALQDAFRCGDFERLLKDNLNINIGDIPKGESETDFFDNAIEHIKQLGKLEGLLKLVFEAREDNNKIKEFKEIYDLYCIVCKTDFEQIKSYYKQVLAETFIDSPEKENIQDINKFFDNVLDTRDYLNNIRKCTDKLRQIQENRKTGTELESYLLVVVENIGSKDHQFRLKAELIKDYPNCSPERHDININGEDELISSYHELPNKLSELITKSESYLWGNNYTLTIELFLPLDYLGEDFDIKITYNKRDQVRSIGEKYRLIIRCLDRYDPYSLNILLKRWERKKCLCNDNYTDHLVDLECLDELKDWQDLADNWNNKEKIGVKLLCQFPPKRSKLRKAFFDTIIDGGVLFALWSRKVNVQYTIHINNLVSWPCIDNFNNLHEEVLKHRKYAHLKGKNAHHYFGYHLGILCENPERVPLYFKHKLGIK